MEICSFESPVGIVHYTLYGCLRIIAREAVASASTMGGSEVVFFKKNESAKFGKRRNVETKFSFCTHP